MGTKTSNVKSKKEEVKFDAAKALVIIQKDNDLDEIFKEECKTDYKVLHAAINANALDKKIGTFIKDVFDQIIMVRKGLRNAYLSLGDDVETEAAKPNINKKRWGIKAIEEDVVKFHNGKKKQIHRTALTVQELKKLYTRLELMTYNQRFVKQTLTDKQLRELDGLTKTFMKGVNFILEGKEKKK